MVKAKLSLCLTNYQAVETYLAVKVYLHIFLTVVPHGGEWSASHPGSFTPRDVLLVLIGWEAG